MLVTYFRQLTDVLWPTGLPGDLGVWAILDGARDKAIFPAVQRAALQKSCLYAGKLPRELEAVAPYLVRLEKGNEFTNLILDKGWGESWGVFLRSRSDLKKLRHHLRGFLRVRDESGRRLIFRYYDPRVLRVYLPTCLPDELNTFFGPIDYFVMEADIRTTALEFGFNGQQLTRLQMHLSVAASAETEGSHDAG